jgi:phage shock protein E
MSEIKTTIIDVRTNAEFEDGHVAGSKNIPLSELTSRVEEIRAIEGRIWLCCASGNRSGQAAAYLKNLGIECTNIGSWLNADYELTHK